jgi:import inner membrane translocase subunit TIM44
MRRSLLQSTSTLATRRGASKAPATAAFSSTSRSRYPEAENQQKQQEKQQQKKQQRSEDTAQAGRSPFAVFVGVLREELQKSRELSADIHPAWID